ncbi:MAG: O-antigen ligase family protein, partial [Albidovulum sp.]
FIPYIIERLPGISSVEQLDIPQRMGFHRVQNVFSHPIHYGLFCSTAFTLVLIGLRGSLSLTNRILGAIAVSFGALMSLSSGALLAIILHVGLIGWAFTFRKLSHKWLLMLAMFVVAYIAIDLLSNRKPLQVFMSYATFNAQTAYYRKIINDWGMINVWANPIFGLGLRDWIRPHYMTFGSVDNFWLLTAMRYGIPGFILLVVGYFSVLIKIGRRNLDFSPNVALLRFAWMVTFCGLSFTLTTVHIWTAMYSFVFFFLGAGLWMADYSASDDTGDAATNPTSAGPARKELAYRRDLAPQPRNQEAAGPVYTRSAAPLANTHNTEREKQPQPTLYARPAEKRADEGKRRDNQIKHSRGKPS